MNAFHFEGVSTAKRESLKRKNVKISNLKKKLAVLTKESEDEWMQISEDVVEHVMGSEEVIQERIGKLQTGDIVILTDQTIEELEFHDAPEEVIRSYNHQMEALKSLFGYHGLGGESPASMDWVSGSEKLFRSISPYVTLHGFSVSLSFAWVDCNEVASKSAKGPTDHWALLPSMSRLEVKDLAGKKAYVTPTYRELSDESVIANIQSLFYKKYLALKTVDPKIYRTTEKDLFGEWGANEELHLMLFGMVLGDKREGTE